MASLKKIASRRTALISSIDVKELWEILNTEQEWIDLPTMTGFCFSGEPTQDHESAVVRAFFNDRHYFKFNGDQFFPLTAEQVIRTGARKKKEEERARFIATMRPVAERYGSLQGLIRQSPPLTGTRPVVLTSSNPIFFLKRRVTITRSRNRSGKPPASKNRTGCSACWSSWGSGTRMSIWIFSEAESRSNFRKA